MTVPTELRSFAGKMEAAVEEEMGVQGWYNEAGPRTSRAVPLHPLILAERRLRASDLCWFISNSD